MQDEVNTKVVAIAIRGSKITAEMLVKALRKFVEELEKAQKDASRPKTYKGKQSIKHLMEQNAAINNIEVTDGNIKSFERTARKYGIDFALKKDSSEQPPRYLVFFQRAGCGCHDASLQGIFCSDSEEAGTAFSSRTACTEARAVQGKAS